MNYEVEHNNIANILNFPQKSMICRYCTFFRQIRYSQQVYYKYHYYNHYKHLLSHSAEISLGSEIYYPYHQSSTTVVRLIMQLLCFHSMSCKLALQQIIYKETWMPMPAVRGGTLNHYSPQSLPLTWSVSIRSDEPTFYDFYWNMLCGQLVAELLASDYLCHVTRLISTGYSYKLELHRTFR